MKNSYLVKPSKSEQIAVVACQPSFVDVDASKNTYTTMSDYLPAVLKPTPFQKWLYDPRIPQMTRRFDPFESAREFHDYLRKGTQVWSGDSADLLKLTSLHAQDWGAPTFTHGDLSSLNILVRGDDVVGIIDWETAGWYPPYWEYTAACQVNPQNSFWRDEIDKFLEPIPDAFEMEQLRQQYLGGSF